MKQQDRVELADELIALATRLRIEAFPDDQWPFQSTVFQIKHKIDTFFERERERHAPF